MKITSWRLIPYLIVFMVKKHVGKIRDLFYCYILRTCHSSNLFSLMFTLCEVVLVFFSGQLVC